MTDARDFVKGWLISRGIDANRALAENEIVNLYLDYLNIWAGSSKEERKVKFTKSDLVDALTSIFKAETAVARDLVLKDLVGQSANLGPLEAWVAAVTGKKDELDVAVIAHWLWMVKRNMLGLSVVHHIMPVIYGRQGSGKTIALQKLFGPVNSFVSYMNMGDLSDSRFYVAFQKYYIAFFDELAGIERADKNALKKQLSAESNTYRVLGSHATPTIAKRCSFIGASNSPIRQVMNDPTGMRRFWQINSAHDTCREIINLMDYKLLWAGVDERLERGYLTEELLVQVQKRQNETLLIADDLTNFSAEHNLFASELTKEVIGVDLYKAYSIWAAKEGLTKKWTLQWLSIRMEDAGLSVRNGLNKDRRVTYLVHKDALIEGQDATKSSNVLSLKKV